MSKISDFIIQCDEEASEALNNEDRQKLYYDRLAKHVADQWYKHIDKDTDYQEKCNERLRDTE